MTAMEPESGAFAPNMSVTETALVSIAVSLKRIADAIPQGDPTGMLSNMAWEVGQSLGRGFEIGSRKS